MLSRRQVLRLVPLGVAGGLAAATAGCERDSSAQATSATGTATRTTAPAQSSTTSAATGAGGQSPPATAAGAGASATPGLSDRQAAATRALKLLPVRRTVTFGVAVHNATTGETFSYRGDKLFETASVVKADILAVRLLQAQDQGRGLSSYERGLARRMITVSDNKAASALWRSAGGASGVRRTNRRLGLRDTLTTNSSWGLTRTSAADQVRLVGLAAGAADSPLATKNAAYLRRLMAEVVSSQDWGVSAAARKGESYAVKNGWLPRSTDSYRWIVNSIGQVSGPGVDLRLAVLTRGNPSQGAGITLIESAVKAVRRELGW